MMGKTVGDRLIASCTTFPAEEIGFLSKDVAVIANAASKCVSGNLLKSLSRQMEGTYQRKGQEIE